MQEDAKAAGRDKRSLRFEEPQSKEAESSQTGEGTRPGERKKLPRRHTGYAFDHPGFESFHANEVSSAALHALIPTSLAKGNSKTSTPLAADVFTQFYVYATSQLVVIQT